MDRQMKHGMETRDIWDHRGGSGTQERSSDPGVPRREWPERSSENHAPCKTLYDTLHPKL